MAYSKQTWDTTSYVNPTRMNHIENGIESVDLTSGGTMTGDLTIDGTTSRLFLGNNTSDNIRGIIRMHNTNGKFVQLYPNNTTSDRNIELPDKSGTMALTSDLKEIQSGITPQRRGTGEMGLRTVTFDKPFSSVPNVVVVPYHATSPHQYIRTCTVQSVSTTGFTFVETALASDLSFYGGNATSDPCYWIATVN